MLTSSDEFLFDGNIVCSRFLMKTVRLSTKMPRCVRSATPDIRSELIPSLVFILLISIDKHKKCNWSCA